VTIEALGSIGELIAAIATIATLFYLAMQIRHSSEATRGASQQALIDTSFDASWELGRDVELARVVGAGLLDFDALNDRDKTTFTFIVQRYVGNLEKGLRLRKMGLIDGETVDSVANGLLIVVMSPGGAKWWQGYRAGAATIVAEYLDRRIADPDANQISWDELWPYWARWVTQERRQDEQADKIVVEQQT
jgi:hypothetical protein